MKFRSDFEIQSKRYDEIRTLLRNFRLNDGFSQKEFSSIAGVHENTIQNLEAGKNVTLDTLFACVDATGMTLSEFFYGIE